MDINAIQDHLEKIIKPSQFYKSIETCKDTSLLFPDFKLKVKNLMVTARQLVPSISLIITETYRSVDRQQYLFTQGSTKLKNVGMHHYGLAVDFAKVLPVSGTKRDELSWKGDWSFLGKLATQHGLVWGGDWNEPTLKHSFQDLDHIQYVTLEEQTEIFKLGV